MSKQDIINHFNNGRTIVIHSAHNTKLFKSGISCINKLIKALNKDDIKGRVI